MPRYFARIGTPARALALAVLGIAACASDPGERSDAAPVSTRPLRVRLVDWRSGQNLTLVDQSHTDRAKLYSETRSLTEAGTKVATDEVLEETVRFFRDQGFFARARPGPASGGGPAQSLEVETPEETVHMDLQRDTSAADAKIFRQCRDNFAALYNNIYQLQAVDQAPDWERQKQSLRKKP